MAQRAVHLDREAFSCSICLDLLKDPGTLPCGHSFCMGCIRTHWDGEDEKKRHSCPQCRRTFTPRPVLHKNTMLADLVEQLTKSEKLQENMCPHHDEAMKMFCRTDQRSICHLCSRDEHKGHDTVSAAAERTERQRELEESPGNVHQRIQDREERVKALRREAGDIRRSADKAVEDGDEMFAKLICLIEERRSDMKRRVRSRQRTEESRVKELRETLLREITELKKLSCTRDHNRFLQNYPSLSALDPSTPSSRIQTRPLRHFEDMMAAVSEVTGQVQDILKDSWTSISQAVKDLDVSLSPQNMTRAALLKYSCDIALDPNTAEAQLLLSEGNRKATWTREDRRPHTDRFTRCPQVLSRESLTGRCYWEVEWRDRGGDVCVAASYKNISRSGMESLFGYNDKSWSLRCDNKGYKFVSNCQWTRLSGPQSSRVGVYLDHRAGVLSFYSISDSVTLLHKVQTTFTQPLHAGLYVLGDQSSAELCELRQK